MCDAPSECGEDRQVRSTEHPEAQEEAEVVSARAWRCHGALEVEKSGQSLCSGQKIWREGLRMSTGRGTGSEGAGSRGAGEQVGKRGGNEGRT
eukprot:768027-Hanusia_phi.AAC.5